MDKAVSHFRSAFECVGLALQEEKSISILVVWVAKINVGWEIEMTKWARDWVVRWWWGMVWEWLWRRRRWFWSWWCWVYKGWCGVGDCMITRIEPRGRWWWRIMREEIKWKEWVANYCNPHLVASLVRRVSEMTEQDTRGSNRFCPASKSKPIWIQIQTWFFIGTKIKFKMQIRLHVRIKNGFQTRFFLGGRHLRIWDPFATPNPI